MAGFDLHTHSTCSDGTCSPAEVVALAARAALPGLALTDHDTLAGWDAARAEGRVHGVEVVCGIELSAERDDVSVHVLGLWVEHDDGALAAECERLRDERRRRAHAILDRLSALGITVDAERVRAIAGDAPVGRPHIAEALVELGTVPDIDTAFERFLGDGRPAWEPKRALDPVSAVGLIRAAGGVAVLAHPGLSGADGLVGQAGLPEELVDDLAAAGLAGIEADHPHHEPWIVEHWRREASERNLLVTGGSDFHGTRKDVKIGARTTAPDVVEALRTRRAVGGGTRW